jgi:hypothetical protein
VLAQAASNRNTCLGAASFLACALGTLFGAATDAAQVRR